ncbi:hypothetical protein N9C16_04800 [Paracoccaceae bacterium]|nr:hypothetical protein [Paracoccaceae bacterium]
MDKVLTRKLFKDRYFKLHKPAQFNKGGIAGVKHFAEGGLSQKEKAILAATFAAPLLQSTRRQGEGILTGVGRALGEGLSKVPSTLIALEEAKPEGVTESVGQATDFEKENILGVSKEDSIVVKRKNGQITGIVSKPTAGERDKAADRRDALASIDTIIEGTKKVRTGPVSGRIAKAQAYLGFNPEAANLNIEIGNFRKSVIKALRGAQVGPAEEASFNEILPFISDPPDIIRAKMEVAKRKLQRIESRLNPNGEVAQKLEAEEIAAQDRELFEKFGIAFDLDTNFDASVPTFTVEGVEVE